MLSPLFPIRVTGLENNIIGAGDEIFMHTGASRGFITSTHFCELLVREVKYRIPSGVNATEL